MTTYDRMDRRIVELLRLRGEPASLYAAQRIENLEREVACLRDKLPDATNEEGQP